MRAVPSSLRLLNQRRILEQLLSVPAASRADLATRLDMSRPTAGKIIDELMEAGVVEERAAEDPQSGKLGRPGRMVSLAGRKPRLILVHLGVRRTEVAAVPLSGPSPSPWVYSFPTPRSEATFLRKLDEARDELRADGAWAFAISIPGVYDERLQRPRLSPNLHWIEGVPLVERIEAQWRLPGCGVQEIRALALGHRAHERTADDFLLVDVEDGVGAAAVLHGSLFEGAMASSGELGHTPIPGNRRVCGCGATGCLETLVSRPGLLQSFGDSVKRAEPVWADLLSAVAVRTPAWMGEAVAALGTTVGGALNMMGLDQVVLTGAVEDWPAAAVQRLSTQVERSTLVARLGRLDVRVAPRRRAEGLVRRLFDRLLIPTEDWSRPGILPRPRRNHAQAS